MTEIPYERQADADSGKTMCGAASLCMVYRSLGLDCAQEEVWPNVARPGAGGRRTARSYLLGADAQRRGLEAVTLKARSPWPALERCHRHGLRVILVHRITPQAGSGHCTVLVDVNDTEVVLHDPLLGPSRTLTRHELLLLWSAGWSSVDLAGQILVAIGRPDDGGADCPQCGTAIPATVPCRRCRQPVPLRPAAALGCVAAACRERVWEYIYCPGCDAQLTEVTPAAAGHPPSLLGG